MHARTSRRKFIARGARAIAALGASSLLGAGAGETEGKRVFVATFAHETNTFHPVRTEA